MRRVILHAFPATSPQALVLVDVERRTITTLLGEEFDTVGTRLVGYDVIVAVDVRALLRAVRVDPGTRRLAELGHPADDPDPRQARTDAAHHDEPPRARLVRHHPSVPIEIRATVARFRRRASEPGP
jgi:hypothetical protein